MEMSSQHLETTVSHEAVCTAEEISHDAASASPARSTATSINSDQTSPATIAGNTPATTKPEASLYADAIDVLLMASNMKKESEQIPKTDDFPAATSSNVVVAADSHQASNTNDVQVAYIPPPENSATDSPPEELFQEKDNRLISMSQVSQVSTEDKMIKRYDREGVTNEVFGAGSKLSQELDYDDTTEDHNSEPAVSLSQTDAQLNEFSLSQAYSLSPDPQPEHSLSQHQHLQLHLQHPEQSQQYSMEMQHPEQSQQYSMSMSMSSLPSLQTSQPFSYQIQDPHEDKNPDAVESTIGQFPALASMKEPILTEKDRQTLKVKSSITQKVIRKTKEKKRTFHESLAQDGKTNGESETSPENKVPKISTSASGAKRPTSYKPRKSVEQKTREENEVNYTANRAVELIDHLASNKKVEKQILLSMALTRTSPRNGPPQLPPHGTKLAAGFQWSQFPPLEKLLRSHMEEYYELSIEVCQSILQQEFNNKLVHKVQEMASFYGWKFDFTFKALRDRVRCYFKTHIQNAKKRLKTMTKNPTKKANAKALASHLDLLEMHEETKIDIQFKEEFRGLQGTTLLQKAEGVDADDNDEDAAKVLGGFRMI